MKTLTKILILPVLLIYSCSPQIIYNSDVSSKDYRFVCSDYKIVPDLAQAPSNFNPINISKINEILEKEVLSLEGLPSMYPCIVYEWAYIETKFADHSFFPMHRQNDSWFIPQINVKEFTEYQLVLNLFDNFKGKYVWHGRAYTTHEIFPYGEINPILKNIFRGLVSQMKKDLNIRETQDYAKSFRYENQF